MPFCTIPEALEELRNGRMVILVDDEDRANEGDLVLPAQFATPDAITFMLPQARGYLCLSLTEADCERLALHPQSSVNTSQRGTPFTVTIDGHPKHGFTTGVSAPERAKCIQMAIDPAMGADDFVRPGHINPLRARDGGTLVRLGQTEGSVDLCKLAGLYPAGVIIEIMRDDGEMARLPDLEVFAKEHNIKICSVAQIIEHRLAEHPIIEREQPHDGVEIATEAGTFTLFSFRSPVDALPHLALTCGGVGTPGFDAGDEPLPVRVHRRDLLGDNFHATSGGAPHASAHNLPHAMRAIQDAGKGVLVYLRPEGRGESHDAQLTRIASAHNPSENDAPDLRSNEGIAAHALPMHMREYGIGGQILRDLGVTRMNLLTNRPKELPALDAFGLEIVEHTPLG